MRTAALLAASALALSACISKPSRPRGDEDAGGGDGDGGPPGGDAGCAVDPTPGPTAWDPDDVIQFNRRAGQLNGDCREDLAVPGLRGSSDENGVFVVFGREDGVMLDGYDGFLATDDGGTVRAPIDVSIARFAGDDNVYDLMVVAQSEDQQESFLLVFQGNGDGTFEDPVVKDVAVALIAGNVETPEPTHVFTAGLDADDEVPSAVFGDTSSTITLSPSDWTQSAVDDAVLGELAGFNEGGLTELATAPSATVGLDDVISFNFDEALWYANLGDLTVTPSGDLIDLSTGPRLVRFGDTDGDGDDDAMSIRHLTGSPVGLELIPLEPGAAPGDPGTGDDLEYNGSAIEVFDDRVDDGVLAQLDDDPRLELVLLDAYDDTFGTRVLILPNVEPDGRGGFGANPEVDGARLAGDWIQIAPPEITFAPNRLAIGTFREGTTEVYVFGSSPGREDDPLLGVSCWRPDVQGDGSILLLECP